ncbi:FUSC family protein [Acetobacter nitrogenifigens]|nr:FUSC family protein [Acetobacter nitrogenifigens]
MSLRHGPPATEGMADVGKSGELGGARKWEWLLAPSASDVGFAIRTSCAAILSLLIAMKLELGSPQWAPLSVWVVATASRGESLSKARWRLLGTLVGCCLGVVLIAAFPQEALLFFMALAVWIALCCGLATFFDGYRSYGLLVAGFTAAIVAVDAIPDPDQAFSIAIARGTYIELGILCEALLAALCSPNLHQRARHSLLSRMHAVISTTRHALDQRRTSLTDASVDGVLLADIMTASARIEFDALELGRESPRAADHAHAAIADLLAATARACANGDRATIETRLGSALSHVDAIAHPARRDGFRFPRRSIRQATDGARNAARVMAGMVAAALIWIVTAWPNGVTFIFNVALVYGLLATRETPSSASGDFSKGAILCAFVAAFYVVLVMPLLTSPEMLAFALLVPMVVGGLAARTPRLVNYAFSFNMFLPVLIGPANQGRYDESAFLNNTAAFLGAVVFAGLMFRNILVFSPDDHLRRTLAWAEKNMRGLAIRRRPPNASRWLLSNADSLVRSVRRTATLPAAHRNAYFKRHMTIMVAGFGVIELREAETDRHTPSALARRIRAFLRFWLADPRRAASMAPRLVRCIEADLPHRRDLPAAVRALVFEDAKENARPGLQAMES